MILTPENDPYFYQTLQNPSLVPGYQGGAFVVDSVTGIMREANAQQMREYIYGGEYDERLEQLGEAEEWDD